MTRTKAAIAIKADQTWTNFIFKKKEEIRKNMKLSWLLLERIFFFCIWCFLSFFSDKTPGLSKSQLFLKNTGLNFFIHILFSNSNLEVEDNLFNFTPKLYFFIFWHSGHT